MGRYFYANEINFKILNLDFVERKPNVNDELIRYEIEIGVSEKEFKTDWILKELEDGGYQKGLTIKSVDGKVIFADLFTADIRFRKNVRK